MNKQITLEQAVERVHDGMTIMFGGFLGVGSATQIIDAIVEKGVKDLTIIANDTAYDEVAHGKLVTNHQVKKAIVEEDERESGRRRLLNFGHTIGKALEKCSDYSIPHGNAVMNGMFLTALAAEDLGWCSVPSSNLIRNVIDAFAYPIYTDYTAAQLAEAAANDKKRASDNIVIVYPDRPGCCAMRELPVSELEDFISKGLAKAAGTA